MSSANILLFRVEPSQQRWSRYSELAFDVQDQIRRLLDGILLDLAEQCAVIDGVRVLLYETEQDRMPDSETESQSVERRMQRVGTFSERVVEAVAGLYKEETTATVMVLLCNNPLFPIGHIQHAMELMQLEDDVVVVADGGESQNRQLRFMATKTFHPSVYSSMQSLTEAGALVVPLCSVRCVSGMNDLAYLYHEIERKMLLGHWVPLRTFEALKRMRRLNILPEE